ncbi:MAG: hypothetical protein N4Q32_03855 [Neisseriaceae bacterium]|nr:hypothetical protein [Neisseriaceae bacterium]MCV2509553.1 hypothetical protein [Neisseriaceae bacterium]
MNPADVNHDDGKKELNKEIEPLVAIDKFGRIARLDGISDAEAEDEEGKNVPEETSPETTDEAPDIPPVKLTVPLDEVFKKLMLDNRVVNAFKEVNDTKEVLNKLPREDSTNVLKGKLKELGTIEDTPKLDDVTPTIFNTLFNTELALDKI